MLQIQHGFLLIADITGYTQYLTQSELEHAQQVLQRLLELLIEQTRPPLLLSRLEGDAVFSYTLPGLELQGQAFLEMVENAYVAFRRAIELMVLNNTCRCNACANIGSLDLKFFVHYGDYGIQRLNGQTELVGSAVNMVHRLMKNHIQAATGIRAYLALTDAAVQRLDLADLRDQLVAHQEQYEHLGTTGVWIQDMHPVWIARRAAQQIQIAPEKLVMGVSTDIKMPPELAWNFLIQPAYRKLVSGAARMDVLDRQQGRIGVGSTYQCFHGDEVIPETVLQWRPFEQILSEDLVSTPLGRVRVLVEYSLTDSPQGARLAQRMGDIRGPRLAVALATFMLRRMANTGQRDLEAFAEQIETELAAQTRSSDLQLLKRS